MKPIHSILKPLATTVALWSLASAASAQVLPWNELSPTASPSNRERSAAATDGTSVLLFGGQVSTTTNGYDELWSFDGITWTLQTASGTGPGPRTSPAMAWDTARGKLVVFSGKGTGGIWANYDNQTWEWSPAGGWAMITPAVSPDPRWLFNMVYVPGVGSVFHGGTAFDSLGVAYTDSDTWAFDGTNWTKIATSGPALNNGKLVYRSTTNDLVYFGGANPSATKVSETWIFDVATFTWSQTITATLPFSSSGGAGLVGAGGFFDPVAGKTIIHGGQGPTGGPSKLTWEFDGIDWTDVTPATSPAIRNYDVVWTPSLSRGISALGSTGSANNETWERGVTAIGTFTVMGTACASQAGTTPAISASTMPAINETLVVDFTNLTAGAIPLALVGTSITSGFGLPLPLPMGIILSGSDASCSLQVSNEVGLFSPTLAPSGTEAALSIPIPNVPSFVGLIAYVQGIQIEFTAGVTASNTAYGEVVVGQL